MLTLDLETSFSQANICHWLLEAGPRPPSAYFLRHFCAWFVHRCISRVSRVEENLHDSFEQALDVGALLREVGEFSRQTGVEDGVYAVMDV